MTTIIYTWFLKTQQKSASRGGKSPFRLKKHSQRRRKTEKVSFLIIIFVKSKQKALKMKKADAKASARNTNREKGNKKG